MPVNFLTDEQNQAYARYPGQLTQEQLDKYFYLDDKDKELIAACRRNYNKLGYALQLTTVRFLGTFLPNPVDVPSEAIHYLVKQLNISAPIDIDRYLERKATRSSHCNEIKAIFDYQDFNVIWRFRLNRWLYSQAWFGNVNGN
jgi:Domain of unknown function (DUF4158)